MEPGHVISLKKQQGFVNLLGQLFTMLGSKVVPHLPLLFSLLLRLADSCNRLLLERHLVGVVAGWVWFSGWGWFDVFCILYGPILQILPHFVSSLKALRQLTINRITQVNQSLIFVHVSQCVHTAYMYL